jgi:hypothetical protein
VQPDPPPSDQVIPEPDGDVRSWGRHTRDLSDTEAALEQKYGRPMRELLYTWRWVEHLTGDEISALCGVHPSTVRYWTFKHRVRAKDLIRQLAVAAEGQP